MKLKVLAAAACLALALGAAADVASDMRELILEGRAAEVLEILDNDTLVLDESLPDVAHIDQLEGEARYALGHHAEAREAFNRARAGGVGEATLWLARLALIDYEFSEASTLYDKYAKSLRAVKKEVPVEALRAAATIPLAVKALERVEQVAIIDSLTVPKEDFFKYYKLPHQAGSLLDKEDFNIAANDGSMTFVNDKGDYAVWAFPDTLGVPRIAESWKLGDGSWQYPPRQAPESLNGNGSVDYPFLMPDGLTLYFANNGDESIGGYDIFVSSRLDSESDFREPQNIGMPFNSPFDDYMLAIDEMHNVGWWATDRKQIADSLTLFVFVPSSMRVNWPADTPGLKDLARINDISATQTDSIDYNSLVEEIRSIRQVDTREPDFIFPLGKGRAIRFYDELPDAHTRSLMARYQESLSLFDKSKKSLTALRRDYHVNGPTAPLKMQIADLEKSIEAQRADLRRLSNQLYKALKPQRH